MLDPLESVKTLKVKRCTISGNEPSSVTLYKTGSEINYLFHMFIRSFILKKKKLTMVVIGIFDNCLCSRPAIRNCLHSAYDMFHGISA